MNATARTTQLLAIDTLLTDEEIAYRDNVRTFVTRQIRPNIARWFEEAHFPAQLAPELGSLGMLGAQLQGYGCPGHSAVEYGLGAMELEAGDSGIRTFVSVQGSLAMTAIHRWGSEEQKEYYLPGMARGEVIGCFALTEPTAGSDPASMLATATPTADGWILRGAKRWIGMASIAQIAIVWARTPDGIRGFIVPTDTPGFRAIPIAHKLSMRASLQCDILLDDVHLPPKAILAASSGLGSALACLNEARYGIIWGVMGAARDSIEAALAYVGQREQFGSAIAARQLVQQKLVDMVVEQQKGALLALHLGRLKDSDRLTPDQISFGKLSNTREAIEICRSARALLGGNGVTLEYSPLRHANNLESVRTYEGTDEMHTLILGQALTGIAAFR